MNVLFMIVNQKRETVSMKIFKILTILSAALVFTCCSVVFTSSITGTLVDEEQYDNGDENNGISDAEVYLYTDEESCIADLEAWTADNTVLPDEPAEGDPVYFLKTITDDTGAYTFNGLIWNELFPEYGKSGDRKEVFMLFYHKNYGLQETATPVYVVSDVTNRIPLFKLPRILNTVNIAGIVKDAKTDLFLQNANVNIWVPETWSYNTDGSINTDESAFTWETSPSYTALTDENGEWNQEISYKMLPSSTDNKGTVILRLTFTSNGYIAENASDSDITDGGWDIDANGNIDPDEDDGYQQTGEISKDTYTELDEIALADEYNTATIIGKLLNSSTNSGEQGVTVQIWVAEDWSYNSSDPDDIEDASSVDWTENPSYTTTTDEDGEYSQDIEFERRPSESNNYGSTRVRLVFTKDTFLIDSTTDDALTDGGWDRDGNGSLESDENDAYYDPAVITKDLSNDLGSITIKQTEFTETLSGEVLDSTGTNNVNGAEIWLFYDPDDATLETPSPENNESPDYVTTSQSVVLTAEQIEKGRFSFENLQWTDDGYTGNQSKVSYYIYLPDVNEKASGEYNTAHDADLVKNYLTAGSTNYISIQQ